jgi:transposase-like protein
MESVETFLKPDQGTTTMENDSTRTLNNVVQIDEQELQSHLNQVVLSTVEDTLNQMLDAEAEELVGASKYERNADRQDYRSGHYTRKLHTKAGEVELKVPKLRRQRFETAVVERYRRRETSVEEAMIEMYLAGVSVRRVEDITQALWGTRVSPGTISKMNKKIYKHIEEWRNRPIEGQFPYVYLDGVVLKRSWGGEVKNVSVLVAIGVGEDGYRRILGVCEGAKEDKAGWGGFLKHLKERGLTGVRLIISDACIGLVESVGDFYPEAAWQRCVVHAYRNVFSYVPRGKLKAVARMLKAIHAQEDKPSAQEKVTTIVEKLRAMKLASAADTVDRIFDETLTYYDFPAEHWRRIRTNNPLERIIREIRRRTRVVGAFPDGESALMLCAARLRHIAGTKWGTRKYLNMELLREMDREREAQVA